MGDPIHWNTIGSGDLKCHRLKFCWPSWKLFIGQEKQSNLLNKYINLEKKGLKNNIFIVTTGVNRQGLAILVAILVGNIVIGQYTLSLDI